MPEPLPTILILCPLRIERAAVGRAIRNAGCPGARVVQTGVGKSAILAALSRELPACTPRLVILAGACGALTAVEDVPPIARIIDEHGASWTPTIADQGGVILVGVDRIISTPADKHTLARDTGAAIVDMEAHAFARACEERGLRWAVVRGVSDTPDETLPLEVLGWITPEGDTRSARAARDLFLHPSLIPHIAKALRRARRVLPKVGTRVVQLIQCNLREPYS